MVDADNRTIVRTLELYIPMEYWELYDWDLIIKRQKEVKEGIFEFDCHFLKLYFDKDMKPVTYGKQKVINDKLFYDYNTDEGIAGTYTFLGNIP